MVNKIFRYINDVFWLLKSNNFILVSSYPKTGSTILRMRLVADIYDLKIIDHSIVNNLSPEIGHGRIKGMINDHSLIVVKTHFSIFSLFLSPKLIVTVLRPPNETLCSHYEYYRRQHKKAHFKKKLKDINLFIKSSRGYRWLKFHLLVTNFKRKSIEIIPYKSYLLNPKKHHDLISKTLGQRIISEKKWELINEITSRDRLSNLENKSKSINQKDFSKLKDYNSLIQKFSLNNSKRIYELGRLYKKCIE